MHFSFNHGSIRHMASRTRKPLPDQPPSAEARQFWVDVFTSTDKAVVLKLMKRGSRATPQGYMHLTAELADAALMEFRRRFPRA